MPDKPKRRFFFNKSHLPFLPIVTPSAPPKASSHAVLAALEPMSDTQTNVPATPPSEPPLSTSTTTTTSVSVDNSSSSTNSANETNLRRTSRQLKESGPPKPTLAPVPRKIRTVQKNIPVVKPLPLTKRFKTSSITTSVTKGTTSASSSSSSSPSLTINGKRIGRPPGRKTGQSINQPPTSILVAKPINKITVHRPTSPPHADPAKKKQFMTAGLYCQDAEPHESRTLVSQVVAAAGSNSGSSSSDSPSFPPLPLDHGYRVFFEQENDFKLPYNIIWESQSGALDGKKRPPHFQKLRCNVFPERNKVVGEKAICRCDPSSGCGDNCINRIMSYLCGKECPCGDLCENRSLTKRKPKSTKVLWTGSRGFGLFAGEDIKEGDFVIDYRGEVIDIDTFINRIHEEYKGDRNYYALAYDRDEVVDSGLRGNDARFINHGCQPNLEVRKLQTMGDGYEEFEIGMWALRDIKAGEELFYDYNFSNFDPGNETWTKCMCAAPNCIGFLGRKAGEKSAKELAAEIEARRAADAQAKANLEAKRASLQKARAAKAVKANSVNKNYKKAAAKATKKAKAAVLGKDGKHKNVIPEELMELKRLSLIKARAAKAAKARLAAGLPPIPPAIVTTTKTTKTVVEPVASTVAPKPVTRTRGPIEPLPTLGPVPLSLEKSKLLELKKASLVKARAAKAAKAAMAMGKKATKNKPTPRYKATPTNPDKVKLLEQKRLSLIKARAAKAAKAVGAIASSSVQSVVNAVTGRTTTRADGPPPSHTALPLVSSVSKKKKKKSSVSHITDPEEKRLRILEIKAESLKKARAAKALLHAEKAALNPVTSNDVPTQPRRLILTLGTTTTVPTETSTVVAASEPSDGIIRPPPKTLSKNGKPIGRPPKPKVAKTSSLPIDPAQRLQALHEIKRISLEKARAAKAAKAAWTRMFNPPQPPVISKKTTSPAELIEMKRESLKKARAARSAKAALARANQAIGQSQEAKHAKALKKRMNKGFYAKFGLPHKHGRPSNKELAYAKSLMMNSGTEALVTTPATSKTATTSKSTTTKAPTTTPIVKALVPVAQNVVIEKDVELEPIVPKTPPKKEAIKKRNGAPMGWAYVAVVPQDSDTVVQPVEPDLMGRGARLSSRKSLSNMARK